MPIRALNGQVVSLQIAPRNDYVLITVQNPEGLSRGGAEIIYSIPIGTGGVLSGEPKRLISVKKAFDQDLFPWLYPPRATCSPTSPPQASSTPPASTAQPTLSWKKTSSASGA